MSEMREGTPEWAMAYMEDAARHTLLDEGSGTKELRKAVKIITTALAEAEARKRRQGLEWQPIETAPKDGKSIPCLSPQYDGPVMLSWFKQNGLSAWRDWDADIHHPTAWFDLPTAPAETQKPEEAA